MAKSIRITGPVAPMIRVTGPEPPRVDPAVVAAALGAEPTGVALPPGGSPIARFGLRMALYRQLKAEARRAEPAPGGPDIGIEPTEWADLERAATLVARPGYTPSATQVARALLRISLQKLLAELSGFPDPAAAPLARELGNDRA